MLSHAFHREGAAKALFERDAESLAVITAETGSTGLALDITGETGVVSTAEEASALDVPVEQWRRVLPAWLGHSKSRGRPL